MKLYDVVNYNGKPHKIITKMTHKDANWVYSISPHLDLKDAYKYYEDQIIIYKEMLDDFYKQQSQQRLF